MMASRALARSVAKRVINRGGETIRPFAAIAASDLAPVLGQDENSVFLKWSSPETQNFTHRGILAQDECKVCATFLRRFGEKERERESEGDLFSSSLSFFLSLFQTLFVRGKRMEKLDRIFNPIDQLFSLSLSLFRQIISTHHSRGQYSLLTSYSQRYLLRSRLYRLVYASPRKRRRIAKRPPSVSGLMPDRDTSPRRRTAPRTSWNTWRLKAPRNERRRLWNRRLKIWVDT